MDPALEEVEHADGHADLQEQDHNGQNRVIRPLHMADERCEDQGRHGHQQARHHDGRMPAAKGIPMDQLDEVLLLLQLAISADQDRDGHHENRKPQG